MEKAKYFYSLTSLRGLFILGIVLYHIGGGFGSPFHSVFGISYKYGGFFGNYFFFLLSGFLMTHSYREVIATDGIDVVSFVVKRIVKFYPLYFLSNLFVMLNNVRIGGIAACGNLKDMIQIFFLVCTGWVEDIYPYNVPCWFVSVLILCYVLFYFVAKVYHRSKNCYYMLAVVLVFWGYILEVKNFAVPFAYVHNGEGFLNFFFGVLFYDLLQYFLKKDNKKKLRAFQLVGLMILLFIAYGSNKVGFSAFCADIRIVITVLILPILLMLAVSLKPIEKILSLKPLTALGAISMSIYFWHMPCLTLFDILKGSVSFLGQRSQTALFGIYFVLLFVVSIISYFLVEKSVWKKFMTKRK